MLVQPKRRGVTRRHPEPHGAYPESLRPRDDGIQQETSGALATSFRRDPHLKHVRDGYIMLILPAPRQTNRHLIDECDNRHLRLGSYANAESIFPLRVSASRLTRVRAAERVGRVGQGTQPELAIQRPFVSGKASDCNAHHESLRENDRSPSTLIRVGGRYVREL